MKHYFESVETVLEHMEAPKTALTRRKLLCGSKNMAATSWTKARKDRLWQIFRPTERSNDHSFDCGRHYFRFAGEPADSIIILMVVLINSILGVVQEGKAEKAIEALQKMSSPYSKVRRNGR